MQRYLFTQNFICTLNLFKNLQNDSSQFWNTSNLFSVVNNFILQIEKSTLKQVPTTIHIPANYVVKVMGGQWPQVLEPGIQKENGANLKKNIWVTINLTIRKWTELPTRNHCRCQLAVLALSISCTHSVTQSVMLSWECRFTNYCKYS